MIVFFNPLSTTPGKQPLPLSLLSLAAVLDGQEPWTLVDGNVVPDPTSALVAALSNAAPSGGAPPCTPANPSNPSNLSNPVLAVTVMPGPQLTQAVDVCRRIRLALPHVPIVWGGYFPTQHANTVLRSTFVDFVIRSQGERPFRELVAALRTGGQLEAVGSLSWKTADGRIVQNPTAQAAPLDELPDVPYERVDMERYIHRTYLGRRTVAHNSSFGCPFACGFCAVVAMSNRRWLAQSPARVERVLRHLASTYRVDAVQMHDMDFFISEVRTAEIAERITPLGLGWWALGRVDTLMQYSDATWRAMARSGLKMIFSGAESSSDTVLAAMNKGGKASGSLPLELVERMRSYGIVPELSFVLGSPPEPLDDMCRTFEFIRAVKRVNPATEVVLYTYTPVPMDGALYSAATDLGFHFPASLDEWGSEGWRQVMMRRGEGIPWIGDSVRTTVRNFERVLNAYYPTVTDTKLTPLRRTVLRLAAGWRYALRWYHAPYELRALNRLLHYQRPETTGF